MATETSDRIEAMRAVEEAIDAAGYEARTWATGDHQIARVYVRRVEYLTQGRGRKVTECGFIEIRDRIDFSHLTRRAGTIEGLCDGIRFFAPTPAESPRPVRVNRDPEDALDQLEVESQRGLDAEADRFG